MKVFLSRGITEAQYLMRNKTIDIAKGLGILLVVFGHSWIVLHEKGELFRVIFSFHMPLFFFLSGVFFKETESLRSLLRSKADSLLKPYFIVLGGVGIAQIVSGKTSILLYVVGLLYSTGSTIAWVQLWFLPHLFAVFVFCWLTLKAFSSTVVRSKGVAILPGLFLVIGVLTLQLFWLKPMSDFGGPAVLFGKRALLPGLPFSVDIILVSSAYLLAGYFASKYVQKLSFNAVHFCFASLIFIGLHYAFDETIDLNRRIYGDLVVSSAQAFAGIYIALSFSALLSSSRKLGGLFAYVGSGSIFILIFHWLFMDSAKVLLESLVPSLPHLSNWFALLMSIVMPLFLFEITKRQRVLSVLLLPRKAES